MHPFITTKSISKSIGKSLLFFQQVIDVSNWISFSEEISFPLKVSSKKANLSNDRLFLLIEAYCINGRITSNAHSLNISQFGIPKAWRADNYLGVIVESDLDHLTKISSVFLSLQIIIDSGLEVGRIESKNIFSNKKSYKYKN